ncbi:divalent cation tolerance protein CutA [Limibacter armeniacum]|uniref:divalent cation tolerance protein CutA n=1 Tax=Limibacter armeniacum TaxID=466084 RepID=UPI002FE68DA3
MIQLNVTCYQKEQANMIASFLLENKLVISVNMMEVKRFEKKDGEVISLTAYKLIGKTKALLFDKIDKQLRELYPDNVPELYSVAIVNMDWEQTEQLVEDTEKV